MSNTTLCTTYPNIIDVSTSIHIENLINVKKEKIHIKLAAMYEVNVDVDTIKSENAGLYHRILAMFEKCYGRRGYLLTIVDLQAKKYVEFDRYTFKEYKIDDDSKDYIMHSLNLRFKEVDEASSYFFIDRIDT